MFRLIMLLSISFTLCSGIAFAETRPVLQNIPDAQKLGSGRLSFLIWDVYDAKLYAPSERYDSSEPFALKLSYLIDLKGADIAERSVEEMRKQGFNDEAKLKEWQQVMEKIFPDVKEGNSLTGIRDASGRSLFYLDDIFIGSVEDEAFTNSFFAIWLDKKTSEPALRKKLLGIKQ